MKKLHVLFVVGLLSVVLLAGCTKNASTGDETGGDEAAADENAQGNDNEEVANTDDEESADDTLADAGDDTEMRIIEVDAERFEFTPSEIRVKQGEKVALKINDIDTTHQAKFETMAVSMDADGNIILDTSTVGTFEFECATMCGSGHRDMKGTVIVEA